MWKLWKTGVPFDPAKDLTNQNAVYMFTTVLSVIIAKKELPVCLDT